MPPAVPVQPEWVQYGSFGLIAFAVIVLIPTGFYIAWLVFNRLLDKFEAVVTLLSKTFTEETKACRDAQEKQAARNEVKEEKDRQSRHELANSIQQLSGQVSIMIDRSNQS